MAKTVTAPTAREIYQREMETNPKFKEAQKPGEGFVIVCAEGNLQVLVN